MPKIVDVAQAAHVSVATVSRVLNNSATVTPARAKRVRAAVQALGYQPNAIARSLRRRGTQVWALIITDINNPFYTAVARGVEDTAAAAGYSILLCNTDEDQERQDRYLDVAAQQQVAGVILTPRAPTTDISRLHGAGIPVVAIDRELPQSVDFVTSTSFEGAVQATEHLLQQGWRRPGCITRSADTATAEQRRLGYLDVVKRHNLPAVIQQIPFHAPNATHLLDELLDRDEPPDSFLTIDSMLALNVLDTLQQRSLQTSDDVGLISFDEADWAPIIRPPLSVIAQPAYDIGATAAQLLLQRVRGEGPKTPQTITMPTRLIVRGSSRKGGRSASAT